jgi:hypothetical protein
VAEGGMFRQAVKYLMRPVNSTPASQRTRKNNTGAKKQEIENAIDIAIPVACSMVHRIGCFDWVF